ncbi:MAG: lytic transglycosylase domain-containing protein [Burkholderiales bacterium]|nr:lytic transglycosylase domain-containing protein [Burkholderiales bacterium]
MAAGATRGLKPLAALAAAAVLSGASGSVQAGAQRYEPLAAAVQAQMSGRIADQAPARFPFDDDIEGRRWLAAMSARLARWVPDAAEREDLLTAVHYEAKRAGLDPQLVLGLIHVESRFRKYAISKAGARGYMQVMPFWRDLIGGTENHNLFGLRTNLRYGCVILRHYLDIERGDLFRALGRYNGSLGKAEYPSLVLRAWEQTWAWPATVAVSTPPSPSGARTPQTWQGQAR